MIKAIVLYLVLSLVFCPLLQAQTTTAVVSAVKAGAWAQGTTRMMPMLLKAGTVTAWAMCGLTPASLALIMGTVLFSKAIDNIDKLPKLVNWLTGKGYRVSDGNYEKQATGYYRVKDGTSAKTDYNTLASWLSSWGSPWVTSIEVYNSESAATARYNELGSQGLIDSGCPSYSGIGAKLRRDSAEPWRVIVAIWTVSGSDTEYVPGAWSPVPKSEVTSQYSTDINADDSSAKDAFEETEDAISKGLDGASQYQDIINAINSTGTTLREILNTIGNNAAPTVSSSVVSTATTTPTDTNISTVVNQSTENQGSGSVAPFVDGGNAGSDNNTVLQTSFFDGEKASTTTAINNNIAGLNSTVSAFVTTLTGKMQQVFEGDGVCSFPISVYEAETELDFCDLPFYETVKTIVLAVAVVVVIIILIM